MTDWLQFNPIPRGTYPCDMRRFRCRRARFEPRGPVYAVGDVSRAGLRKNPRERIDVVPRAARLFVGLNVGQDPKYTVDDVVRITKRVRKEQGELPDSSFLLQRGLFTDEVTAATVEENSVQVVIFNFDEDEAKFEDEMGALAETLARELQQQVVYVEMQRRGIPYAIYKVTP